MKNPPHTAHINHSRLKECRLVLSGTRALPLWTRRVVEGKYTLIINNDEKSPERQGPCAGEDQSALLQPAVADVGCVWRILHH